MKLIVLPSTNTSITDSKEYVYPNITEVKLTIGVAYSVYSHGIPILRFYDEAKRLFSDKENKDQFMTIQKFYKNHFALVIDLRSNEERNGTGLPFRH